MKLTLFSQEVTNKHVTKLKEFVGKTLEDVNFLYINTPGNYKPFKSKWMIEGENRWRKIFPKFQEFDLERAFKVDKNFDFEEFYSNYDYIFISGGTVYILTYWMQKTGSTKIIRDLIMSNKVIYGGESAGAIFSYSDMSLYSSLDYPERAPERIDEGLSIIDFAPIPHWGNSAFQEGLEKIESEFGANGVKTYKITDSQAIFVEDEEIEII